VQHSNGSIESKCNSNGSIESKRTAQIAVLKVNVTLKWQY
jgi:hypothetical protein